MKNRTLTLLILNLLLIGINPIGLKRRKLKTTQFAYEVIMLIVSRRKLEEDGFKRLSEIREEYPGHVYEIAEIEKGFMGIDYEKFTSYTIALKTLPFKENDQEFNDAVKNEIFVLHKIKGVDFSLPLCKTYEIKTELTEKKKESSRKKTKKQVALGFELIVPRFDRNLFNYCEEKRKNHLDSKNKLKSFPTSIINAFRKTKTSIVKDSKTDFDFKFSLIFQLASAIRNLHDKGFIHGNIKLNNVLIREETQDFSTLVLTGFGFAKEIKEGYDYTDENIKYVPIKEKNYLGKNKKERYYKTYNSPKGDIHEFGLICLNILIPQFFSCMSELECKFKNFTKKINVIDADFETGIQEFREYLKKEVRRTISEKQQELEDLIFDHILVEYENRIGTEELYKKLKEINPLVEDKISENREIYPVKCPGYISEDSSIEQSIDKFEKPSDEDYSSEDEEEK